MRYKSEALRIVIILIFIFSFTSPCHAQTRSHVAASLGKNISDLGDILIKLDVELKKMTDQNELLIATVLAHKILVVASQTSLSAELIGVSQFVTDPQYNSHIIRIVGSAHSMSQAMFNELGKGLVSVKNKEVMALIWQSLGIVKSSIDTIDSGINQLKGD